MTPTRDDAADVPEVPPPGAHGAPTAIVAGRWVVAAAWALALWAQRTPAPGGRLDVHSPFTQLVALRPPLAAMGLIVGVAALTASGLRPTRPAPDRVHSPTSERPRTDAAPTREPRLLAALRGGLRQATAPAILLAVVALGAVAEIAPRATGGAEPAPPTAARLTVLAANDLRSSVTPGTLVGLARRVHADVLALPETNALLARAVARGLSTATGEHWAALTDTPGGRDDDRTPQPTSLVLRAALGPRRRPAPAADRPDGNGQVRVHLTRLTDARGRPVAGATAEVAAVHPRAPAPVGSQSGWRTDLRDLVALADPGHIVAGDLNATLDHSPVRRLTGAGLEDAAAAAGHGLAATWTGGPFGGVRPAIDHVLSVAPWRATASGVLRLPGSDHRALWARLARTP